MYSGKARKYSIEKLLTKLMIVRLRENGKEIPLDFVRFP